MKAIKTLVTYVFLFLNIVILAAQDSGDGLTGYYYENYSINDSTDAISFDNLTLSFTRVDTTIDFWNGNKYYAMQPVSGWPNRYSINWVGYIYISEAGEYGFGTISDDGSQIYIDSVLIVDNSEAQWYDWEDNISEGGPGDTLSTSFPPLELEAGYHSISVSFYENASYDGIELWWLKPCAGTSDIPYYGENFHAIPPTYNPETNWEIVPKSVLFTEPVATSLNDKNIDSDIIPSSIELLQNFPNPFNPRTVIRYKLLNSVEIEISIYNILGQKVKNLISGVQTAGTYRVNWDAENLTGGVYFCRLTTSTGEFRARKLILIK